MTFENDAQLLEHLMHTENGYYLVIEYREIMHLNIIGKTIYIFIY